MDIAYLVSASKDTISNNVSGWEVASAIGTIGATFVALALGMYQWLKDISRQRDVRAALAKALHADLATWREVVDGRRKQFDEKKLTHEAHYVAWTEGLKLPTMPTHERFYMMLPDLGRQVSTEVVRAYAGAMRVGEVIQREIQQRVKVDRDYVLLASETRPILDVVHEQLTTAMKALERCSV